MSFDTDDPFPEGADPLDLIARDHAMHARLCALLEEIADSLPDRVTTPMAAAAADAIKTQIALHVLDEELGLFPLIRAVSGPDEGINDVLDLLSHEHEADLDFARELIEALEELARAGKPHNPEMLGYMLRGFFEMQRRHQAWEDAVVMPVARRCLAETALTELAVAMRRHRREPPEASWTIVFASGGRD